MHERDLVIPGERSIGEGGRADREQPRAGEIAASALFRLANESPRKSLNNSQDDTATAPRPMIGHATS